MPSVYRVYFPSRVLQEQSSHSHVSQRNDYGYGANSQNTAEVVRRSRATQAEMQALMTTSREVREDSAEHQRRRLDFAQRMTHVRTSNTDGLSSLERNSSGGEVSVRNATGNSRSSFISALPSLNRNEQTRLNIRETTIPIQNFSAASISPSSSVNVNIPIEIESRQPMASPSRSVGTSSLLAEIQSVDSMLENWRGGIENGARSYAVTQGRNVNDADRLTNNTRLYAWSDSNTDVVDANNANANQTAQNNPPLRVREIRVDHYPVASTTSNGRSLSTNNNSSANNVRPISSNPYYRYISYYDYAQYLSAVVEKIYQEAGRVFEPTLREEWKQIEQTEINVAKFHAFLKKLHAGGNEGEEGKVDLSDVVEVLETIKDDSELRKLMFGYAAGELSDCHDRRLSAFNDMQAAAKISRLKNSSNPADERALLSMSLGLLRQERLKQFITQQLKQQGRSDTEALELEMRLHQKLGDVLGLPFPMKMQNQLFAEIVFANFLNDEFINQVIDTVLIEAERDQSTLVDDLLIYRNQLSTGDDSTWLAYLKQKYGNTPEIEAIRTPLMQQFEAIGDRLTAAQNGPTPDQVNLESEKKRIVERLDSRKRELERAQARSQSNPLNDMYRRTVLVMQREVDQLKENLAEINKQLQLSEPYTQKQYDEDVMEIGKEKEAAEYNFYKAITLSLL